MEPDRKIALFIGGALLLALAAIAVLSIPSGSAPPEPAPVATTASPEPARTPAVVPAAFPNPEPEVSAGTPEEAEAFQVEPGVNYLARGIEAYRERNWEHAVAYLRAETGENPDRPYSLYLLGLTLWKSGELDEASEVMGRAGELDPDSIKTFINLARVENDRREFKAALDASRTALGIDPDDPTALFLEGRSLRNLDERAVALTSLERSVEIDAENGFVWNLLGLVHMEEDRDADARDALERAVVLEPGVAYIQNNWGMVLERHGENEAAVAAYRRAVELDPDHTKAALNLARLEPLVPGESLDAAGTIARTEP